MRKLYCLRYTVLDRVDFPNFVVHLSAQAMKMTSFPIWSVKYLF